MEDLATIGMSVDARPVDAAGESLDRLTQKGGQAERAVDSLIGSTKELGGSSRQAAAGVDDLDRRVERLKASVDPLYVAQSKLDNELREAADLYKRGALAAGEYEAMTGKLNSKLAMVSVAHRKVSDASKLHSHEVLNLTRQFSDLGVTAAMGMNPLMILIQQGPQIGETLAMASARGIGFNAVLKQMAGLAWGAIAPFAPLIAGVAGAALVLGGSFAIATKEANRAAGDLTKGLNLTKDEIEKLKEEGVATQITFGDTFAATFRVAGERLYKAFEGPIKAVQGLFSTLYKGIVDGAQWMAQAFTAVVIGIGRIGKEIFSGLADAFRGDFAGAAEHFNKSVLDTLKGTWNQAGKLNKDFFDDVVQTASKARRETIEKALDRKDKAAKKTGKTDAEKEYERLVKETEAYIEALKKETAEVGLSVREKKLLEIQTAALKAPTKELREQVEKLGAALVLKSDMQDLLDGLKAFKTELASSDDWTIFDQASADADRFLDRIYALDDGIRSAASSMSQSFGSVGSSLAGLISSLSDYTVAQAEVAAHLAKVQKDDPAQYEYEKAKATAYLGRVQVKTYGDMASSAKGFFKEKSTGYKILEGAEKAFRAVEFAMSVRSMAQDLIETARKMAGSASRAAAYGSEAIANALKSVPFPLNLAAAAATGAALVAAGVAVFGGGGGSSVAVPSASDRQDAQGTGSVFGDASAKSASLTNSLELAIKYQNKDLEYSNQMVRSLRTIEGNIGTLTAAVARTLQVGGSLDTSNLKLGSSVNGGLLGKVPLIGGFLGGLFGSKKKTELNDLGLEFDPQSLSDILSGGIDGRTYQELITTTKKKFLGITTGTKTSVSTQTGELEDQLASEINGVIASLRDGVLAAASVLGLEGAQAALDSFTVNLGKISFKDMTGDEIKDTLNAVFGRLGDDMAAAVGGQLVDELKKVGEGAFETLVRLAKGVQVFDVQLQVIGKTVNATGFDLVRVGQGLIDLAGGIEEFIEQTNAYAESFLTEAERIAPVQRAVANEMSRLGFASVDTKNEFKALVNSLDLATDEGAELFAALMKVAPAFAKVTEYANEAADSRIEEAQQGVSLWTKRLTEAYNEKTSALRNYIGRFEQWGDSLGDLMKSLTVGSLSGLSPKDRYEQTKALFEETKAKALSGDEDAQRAYVDVSKQFVEASRDFFASSPEFFADQDAVKAATQEMVSYAAREVDSAKAQLAALDQQVSLLIDIKGAAFSINDSIAGLKAAMLELGAAKVAKDQLGGVEPEYDLAKYIAANPDLRANWDAGGTLRGEGGTFEEAAAAHLRVTGRPEIAAGLRKPFAHGGIGDRPMTVGEAGIAFENGPEGLFPLRKMANGDLGVKAVGGLSTEKLEALLEQLVKLVTLLLRQGGASAEKNREAISLLAKAMTKLGDEVRRK